MRRGRIGPGQHRDGSQRPNDFNALTSTASSMPECFCPEELGGACHFEPVTNDWSDWRSDWMPTNENFPVPKKDGGKVDVDNTILANRLCNRLDHSLRVGRSHRKDRERIRKAREEGIRRNTGKARYLLDHPTISDRSWTNEPRLLGEKRDAFIRRILLG